MEHIYENNITSLVLKGIFPTKCDYSNATFPQFVSNTAGIIIKRNVPTAHRNLQYR